MEEIQNKIRDSISKKIAVSHLVVEGDGSHFQAIIVSNAFDRLGRVTDISWFMMLLEIVLQKMCMLYLLKRTLKSSGKI